MHVVPCCCVWAFNRSAVDGLLPVAAQSPEDSAAGIMRCVVEDVTQSSFKFFGGSACSRKQHQPQKVVKEVAAGGGGTQARLGVSQATQRQSQLAAASGWVTAACLPQEGELPAQAGELPAKAPAASGFASAAALTQHHTQAVGEEEELCDPFSHDVWEPEGEPGMGHGSAPALASRPKQDVSREREAWQRLATMLQGLRVRVRDAAI